MTKEEIEQFKEEINNTILPHIINVPEDKIYEIIKMVENENPDLPDGFGNMLYEQLLVMKGGLKQEVVEDIPKEDLPRIEEKIEEANDLTKFF